MEKKSFVKACRDFFLMKEGQKLMEFAAELKELTDKDRADFVDMFKTIGIEIEQ
jgi:intergrase/recombinase